MPDAPADRSKFVTLPGNGLVTAVVDLESWRTAGTNRRCGAMFNRVLAGTAVDIVQFEFGTLRGPIFVPGSTKAGVELEHPLWTFVPALGTLATTVSCGGIVRGQLLSSLDARWTALCFVTYRRNTEAVGDRHFLTGPFTWAGVYNGTTTPLCYGP